MQRAKADGAHVIGYNYWSLTDNYEWGGYRPRFGLYMVDAGCGGPTGRRTGEAGAPDEHFVLAGGLRSVPDGSGGTLTAAIGQRYPTADGHGQLVFFWHGTRFLGLDSVAESDEITGLRPAGPGAFLIGYRHYAANDPECCPSLAPVTVTYRWTGARLAGAGTPPQRGTPVRVHVPS